jgi:hypothetical protein
MQDRQAMGTRADTLAAHHQRLAHDAGTFSGRAGERANCGSHQTKRRQQGAWRRKQTVWRSEPAVAEEEGWTQWRQREQTAGYCGSC